MIAGMQNHVLKYGAYTSTVAQGKRIRRMMRTQLSLEKIVKSSDHRVKLTESQDSKKYSLSKIMNKRSQPKLQSIANKKKLGKQSVRKIIEIRYEYYNPNGSSDEQQGNVKNYEESKNLLQKSYGRRSLVKTDKSMSIQKVQKLQASQKNEDRSKLSSLNSQKRVKNNQQSTNKKNLSINMFSQNNRNSQNSRIDKNIKSSAYQQQPIQNEYEFNYDVKMINQQQKSKKNDEYHRQSSNQNMNKRSSKGSILNSRQHRSKIGQRNGNSRNLNRLSNYKKEISSKRNSQNGYFSGQMDHISGRSSIKSNFKSRQFNKVLDNISSYDMQQIESRKIGAKSSGIKNQLADSRAGLGISLKLDSIRNDNNYNYNTGGQTSRSRDRGNSFKNLPLTSRQPSMRRSLVVNSLDQPCTNNIEDVYQRVEIYNYLLGLIYQYRQSTMSYYETQQYKYEILCFLLDLKYFYEKINLLKSLTTKKSKNVFTLLPIQISNQILHEYIGHQRIKQFTKELQEFRISQKKKLDKQAQQLLQRHTRPEERRFIVTDVQNDNFTSEIVRRLKIEMQRLYEEWDQGRQDSNEEKEEKTELRMIQTMELIFFFSELRGKKVKKLEFSEEITNFEEYYEKYLPKLIETYIFFEKGDNK